MHASVLSLARPAAGTQLIQATVSGSADNWFFVDGADGCERALRAESCLLDPAIGDTVLLCTGDAGGPSYILAILARAASRGATLTLPGGAAIVSDDGQLRLSARRVEVVAAERVTLGAPRFEVSALRGDLRIGRLCGLIEALDARVGAVTLVASTLSSSVGRLVQKARDAFRFTENLDETRAGRVRVKVDGRYHLEAAHAAILAEHLVKIDGEKIDLG